MSGRLVWLLAVNFDRHQAGFTPGAHNLNLVDCFGVYCNV